MTSRIQWRQMWYLPMMLEREILLFLEWSAHRQGLSPGDNGETLFLRCFITH